MLHSAPTGGTMYAFQQQPKSGAGFRDQFTGKHRPVNLMSDRRVVRGNTYAAQVLPLSAQAELARAEKEAASMHRRRIKAAKVQAAQAQAAYQKRLNSPEPVEGRRHMDIQTEQYLEELTDKPEEITQVTQTDPMLDRPMTPTYVPFKTGRDAETQIEPGDLFDFEAEVDPILDVMVGKTLEQAMLEVLQEEEVELMRHQQMEFEQRRQEEVLESQRLEAAEKRKFEEKERRKKAELARITREKETRNKLCARMFAKGFLNNLENRVFARLEDEGWFHDEIEREVELELMPWLFDRVEREVDNHRRACQLVDDLLYEVAARQIQAVFVDPTPPQLESQEDAAG